MIGNFLLVTSLIVGQTDAAESPMVLRPLTTRGSRTTAPEEDGLSTVPSLAQAPLPKPLDAGDSPKVKKSVTPKAGGTTFRPGTSGGAPRTIDGGAGGATKKAQPRREPPVLSDEGPSMEPKKAATKAVPKAATKAAPKAAGVQTDKPPATAPTPAAVVAPVVKPPADPAAQPAQAEQAKKDAAKADAAKGPLTSQIDVPYRTPSINNIDPWETSSWWITQKNLYLTRSQVDDPILVTDNNGNPLARSANLDLPAKFGQEVSLGYQWDSADSAEVLYTWLADSSSIVGVKGSDLIIPSNVEILTRLPTTPASFLTQNVPLTHLSSVNLRTVSKFWGTEFNYIRKLRDGTDQRFNAQGLIGFRVLSIGEDLQMGAVNLNQNAPDINIFANETVRNNLYGGQFGLRGTVREILPSLNLDGLLKFGLYGNLVSRFNNAGYSQLAPNQLVPGTTGRDGQFSQVVDGSIDLVYKVFESVHVTVGYRFIYVAEVARATEQIVPLINGLNSVTNSSSDLFMNGLQFGLRFYWGERADPNCKSGCCTPYVFLSDCTCQ